MDVLRSKMFNGSVPDFSLHHETRDAEMQIMSNVLFLYAKMADLYNIDWNISRDEILKFLEKHSPNNHKRRACPEKGPPGSST